MDNNVGKIFLGGLPRDCTEETLTQYFVKFGEIMEATVVRDNVTGNSRGFGFIKFKDPDSVQTALATGNHTIDGKSIDAKPLKQKQYGGQGGGFGQNSSVAGMMGGGGYQNRGGNGFGRGGMMRGPQGERRGPGGDAQFNHRPAAGDHPYKLFVGGLPRHGCDEGTLREYFSQYGNVTDILIPTDRESRQPKGFAFITYETEEDAARATEKRFQEIMSKKVEVKRCEQRGERSQNREGGGGNAGFMQQGFGGGSGGGNDGGYGGRGGGYQGGQGHSYGQGGGGGYGDNSGGYGYGSNSSGGYGGQGNSGNSYSGYQGYGQGGQGGRGGGQSNQMMGYGGQGQTGGGGASNQSGQGYPGQSSGNMSQTPNSTVPFNAAGTQSSPQNAQNQYQQYAMWYAMQQQAQIAAAAAANPSNPAGGASSANSSTSQAMGGNGQDLAANYQNYLLQYQQQNSNASQALAGMSGNSSAPTGVPPPAVGVPPQTGGSASSQSSAASNPASFFGYPNQQGFGQVTPSAAAAASAAPNNSAGNPGQAQGSNPEFYNAMYAQYIAALSNQQQQSSNAAPAGAHGR